MSMYRKILVAIDGSECADVALAEAIRLAGAGQAELVIIGTHGRRGLKRLLLGSVAEGLVRQCVVPVMLVRPAPAAENAAT